MLSKKAIDEFKVIWKKQYNEDISDEDAEKWGTELVNLVELIYRPIPKHNKVKPD